MGMRMRMRMLVLMKRGGDGEYGDYIKMKGLHEYLFMYLSVTVSIHYSSIYIHLNKVRFHSESFVLADMPAKSLPPCT